MKRLIALVALFSIGTAVAGAAPTYDVGVDTTIRSTVLFVGDSNISRGAAQITAALTTRTDGGHLPVLGSRSGMGIRGYGKSMCPGTCAASDYWELRLPRMLASVTPTAVVIDLGINDAALLGTPTGLGYGAYASKIDWLIAQFPDVPIFWTNLPCALESGAYRGSGCTSINVQLDAAVARHANLTILRWNSAALGHADYMGVPGIAPHYTPAGYTAWSKLVVKALDARFPA